MEGENGAPGYGDYCPIARACDVLATRWTPLIVRNLLMGCRTFSDVRAGIPEISKTLLTQRLRMLEFHGLVERRAHGGRTSYHLTPSGMELEPVIMALGRWGEQWVELGPEHFDARRVVWWLTKKIDPGTLPDERTVVRFDVPGSSERYWLLLERPNAEVCMQPPGGGDDLIVSASAETLVRWHTGQIDLGTAMATGDATVTGPQWLERMLASWGGTGSLLATG
ncbi:MAG: helix-turn-helix transcriptional regulator [Solirubrobacteraceae bacterium]|nr:helix-turn-helix transcriptional regulator [Solirubrobacteraceae bacterium]